MSGTAEPMPPPAPRSNLARRIAIILVLSVIFSLALWLMALSAMTSLLAGTGAGVIILAADMFEAILETIGGFVLGLLAAIGAILGALFASLVE